jgi:hypothetical protein
MRTFCIIIVLALPSPSLAQPKNDQPIKDGKDQKIAPPKNETPQEKAERQKREEQEIRNAEAAAAALGTLGVATMFSFICMFGIMLIINSMPIWIALYRSHPDMAAIALITIFLGWTCIGWWIALIWSVKAFPPKGDVNVRVYNNPFD